MTDTKRLKLVVMTGIEIGSLEDNNVKEWPFLRLLWNVELGLVTVGVALEEEAEAGFNEEGGRDEESKSWGKREIAGEGEDNAELVDDDDPLRLDVGDGGGDGFGRPVIIFVAGRMSLLAWPFFPLIVSDIPRRRIAPTGISMYSNVAMKCRRWWSSDEVPRRVADITWCPPQYATQSALWSAFTWLLCQNSRT